MWVDAIMKHCKYCDQSLPLTEFYKRKESPDGLAYKCRACQKKVCGAFYLKNKQKAFDSCLLYTSDAADD